MNNNYIHITLVIDESGSMYSSREDVIGGVKKIVDEQKANKDGKCTVSLYTFNSKVNEVFVGKDVNDVGEFKYDPHALTAMNDGIAMAIDNTGKWLADMKEEDRPSKVMVCVFTDGCENASKEFTLEDVKKKIEHQEQVYSWTFVYMGTDITTTKAANDLGFKLKTYASRKMMGKNYDIVNYAATAYRKSLSRGVSLSDASFTLSTLLEDETVKNTKEFEKEIGKKLDD